MEAISQHRAPRVLLFGMSGQFSSLALSALLEAGIEVCAVVMPASSPPGRAAPAIQHLRPPTTHPVQMLANVAAPPTVAQIAWRRQIPVWSAYRLKDMEMVATLASYQADVICVACFPRLLPSSIINLPRFGCLNMHPSLLPANRGPDPLFWTFRNGEPITGVTIHMIDEGIDSGAILAQSAIDVADGASDSQLEKQCAIVGGPLLARSVWQLYHGSAICMPQDETKSSYYPRPTRDNLIIPAERWSARHVYNFICGVCDTWGPALVECEGRSWYVHRVDFYSLEPLSRYRDRRGVGGGLLVPCRDGHVVLTGVEDVPDEDQR